jgi:hypothetical protein
VHQRQRLARQLSPLLQAQQQQVRGLLLPLPQRCHLLACLALRLHVSWGAAAQGWLSDRLLWASAQQQQQQQQQQVVHQYSSCY